MTDLPSESRQFVSALQVAQKAGVSRSAVSRAFTPGASIAPETRDKVMRAADALGYQVNDLARGLLANRSRLVGLVVTKPEIGFRALLVAALTKALIARGSVPIMINTGQTEAELQAAQRTLFGHRAEATIILSGSPPASFVDLARRNGQPVVVIGRSEPDVDHVQIDNAKAVRQVVRQFVGNGAKLLGYVGSRSGTPSIMEREKAFRAEVERLGVHVVAAHGDDTDYAGGFAAGQGLLARVERPEAIFCVNDLMAFGVMDYARQRLGLSIPDDLAVVGFDDLPEADWLAYGLSSFRQDPASIAAAAISLLDQRASSPDMAPARAHIAAPLVVRQSFIPKASDDL